VISLLALDLDGTLMGDDMVIRSDRVLRAIEAAQARGVLVTLATGRMFDHALPYARELGITAPLICYQGGVIRDVEGAVPFYRVTMAPELVREVLAWRAERGYELALYAGEGVFIDERRRPESVYHQMLGSRLVWVDDLATVAADHDPLKFVVFVAPGQTGATADDLRRRFGERVVIARSHEIIVEGNPPGVSKGGALAWLAAHLGVSQAQVMAIGDQDNDVSMIDWAGIGVAMGNASAATKAVADWVAPSVADDGAAVAIERFILDDGREEVVR
jgi:Cof subfamily protein (haloacid dehalogenase superfamily)